jgi:hypothetical protein
MTGLREITGQAVKVTMTKFGTWRTRNSWIACLWTKTRYN